MPEKQKIISITDLTAWLYCPRKLYLTKVKRISQPLTKEMLAGKIKHSILENFSKKEKELISKIETYKDNLELVFIYEDFLKQIATSIFYENREAIDSFKINSDELLRKILKDFTEDIRLRVKSINEKLAQGFFKEKLFDSLDTIYISELSLESEHYALRGRVDRIQISKLTNQIIPFELKNREQKIFLSDEIQLTAYAMLLEDHFKTIIKNGIVEAGSLKKEIEITQEKKDEVLRIAEEIRNMPQNFAPPMQSNFAKCKSCSLNEICPNM